MTTQFKTRGCVVFCRRQKRQKGNPGRSIARTGVSANLFINSVVLVVATTNGLRPPPNLSIFLPPKGARCGRISSFRESGTLGAEILVARSWREETCESLCYL
jgi:hypothetical protein